MSEVVCKVQVLTVERALKIFISWLTKNQDILPQMQGGSTGIGYGLKYQVKIDHTNPIHTPKTSQNPPSIDLHFTIIVLQILTLYIGIYSISNFF